MIQIRSFDGEIEELQQFIVSTWSHDYAGKMAFPLWPTEYFNWQLGINAGVSRDHLLAAYDDGKLVGCVLGVPYKFQIPSGILTGTLGSWLSIAPESRRLGIASQLKAEIIARHAAEGSAFQLGYRYFGSKHSKGSRFWKDDPLSPSQFLGRVGFLVRVLDAPRAAAWNVNMLDRVMIRLFSTWYPGPKQRQSTVTVRPYVPDDLPECLTLIHQQTEPMSLSLRWEADTLGRHLQPGSTGRSLVAVREGRVVGFVAYHAIPFQGLTTEPVGVIDIVQTTGMSFGEQRCLVDAMLYDLKNLGAVLALKLRIGDYGVASLLSLGFVPRAADSHLVANWATPRLPIPSSGNRHILWR
ncbi:MAG: GNAT family N-acetyltransferase [Planctomycetaceae bacterium]